MCGLCGGLLKYLGRLGRRDHFRCYDCGADQSTEALDHRPNRPKVNGRDRR